MVWLPFEVLSYSVSVAERLPVALGLNVTEMVHVAPAASVFAIGQVLV
jgi:hypothetical protein